MAGNITKSFSLNTKTDAALIARLDALGRGELSGVVRDALNAYFELGNGVTLALMYSKLNAIERKLDRGVVVTGAQSEPAQNDTGDTLGDDILGAFD